VTHRWERYDALVALSRQDTTRWRRLTQPQGRRILARDGRQPAVGQEVLWGLRDGLAGEGLLARRFRAAPPADLATLLREVKQALEVPLAGGLTAEPRSRRAAVAEACPEGPHPLCHLHSLPEAAQPI